MPYVIDPEDYRRELRRLVKYVILLNNDWQLFKNQQDSYRANEFLLSQLAVYDQLSYATSMRCLKG